MEFCNWYTVHEKYFQHDLPEINCMDISTKNFVKMDNIRNNLIQHSLIIGDNISNKGTKRIKEVDTNEAYNILWKSLQFLKSLDVLKKVYKKLKNEPNLNKKIELLKKKDKLMREKPLKVMGLPVSYSDTSISISAENELPPFKKAILEDTFPTELKGKPKRVKKTKKIKRKETVEKKPEEVIEEEPKDLEAHVVKPGRTTSSKKDYQKNKRKKMAELKGIFPDPLKVRKKVPKDDEEEKEEPILEEMSPMHEEKKIPIEEAIEEEEEPQQDIEDKNKKIAKPPKPKKRIIKQIKKKELPKEEPPKEEPPKKESPKKEPPKKELPKEELPKPPAFKLRDPLPTDKRRESAPETSKHVHKQHNKRRFSSTDKFNYTPSKIDLKPLNIKLPNPPRRKSIQTPQKPKPEPNTVGKLRPRRNSKAKQSTLRGVGKLQIPEFLQGL